MRTVNRCWLWAFHTTPLGWVLETRLKRSFLISMITGEQIKAARMMLRLSQREFAMMTHVTIHTVQRMEQTRGPLRNAGPLIEAVRTATEAAGIEFIPSGPYVGNGGPGIRLKGDVIVEQIVDDTTVGALAVKPKRKEIVA